MTARELWQTCTQLWPYWEELIDSEVKENYVQIHYDSVKENYVQIHYDSVMSDLHENFNEANHARLALI